MHNALMIVMDTSYAAPLWSSGDCASCRNACGEEKGAIIYVSVRMRVGEPVAGRCALPFCLFQTLFQTLFLSLSDWPCCETRKGQDEWLTPCCETRKGQDEWLTPGVSHSYTIHPKP
jgi:hypothetical protein